MRENAVGKPDPQSLRPPPMAVERLLEVLEASGGAPRRMGVGVVGDPEEEVAAQEDGVVRPVQVRGSRDQPCLVLREDLREQPLGLALDVRLDDGERAVGRAVVDADHLQVVCGLCQQRVEAARDGVAGGALLVSGAKALGEAMLDKQVSDYEKLEAQREADKEEVRRIMENVFE